MASWVLSLLNDSVSDKQTQITGLQVLLVYIKKNVLYVHIFSLLTCQLYFANSKLWKRN